MGKKVREKQTQDLSGIEGLIYLTGQEGSGSTSDREFIQFLNVARRSTFENANMLIIFDRRKLIPRPRRDQLLERLDHLSRKITSFQRTLRVRT